MDPIQLNPWALLYAGAALQGLFVAGILLSTSKGNTRANKLLAMLVLAFSWTRFLSFLSLSELYRNWPHLPATGAPLWFVLAPIYYFYVKALLAQPVRWNWFGVMHALPALAILIHMSPFYLLPAPAKLARMLNPDMSGEARLIALIFSLLYGLQNVMYLGMCIKALQMQTSARATESVKPGHLGWLKFLFTLMLLFALFHVAVASVEFFKKVDLVAMDYLPMAFFTVMVYAIAYLGMQQPEKLFPPQLRIGRASRTNAQLPLATGAVLNQLRKIMETEKPYLDCNLKYSDVAARLGISVRALSRILNEALGQSFTDFVNAYRVQEVKQQLARQGTGEHTLLALALDAGFNSKTSFNRIFKSHTGMTPTQFLQAKNTQSASEASVAQPNTAMD